MFLHMVLVRLLGDIFFELGVVFSLDDLLPVLLLIDDHFESFQFVLLGVLPEIYLLLEIAQSLF